MKHLTLFASIILLISSLNSYAGETQSHLTASLALDKNTLNQLFRIPSYPIVFTSYQSSPNRQNRSTATKTLINEPPLSIEEASAKLERAVAWQEFKVRFGMFFGYFDEKSLTDEERIYLKQKYNLGDISDIKTNPDAISDRSIKEDFDKFLKKLFNFRIEEQTTTISLRENFNISSANPIKLSDVNIGARLKLKPCIDIFGIKKCVDNVVVNTEIQHASMNIDVEIEKENNTFKNLIFRFNPDSTNLSYVDLNFKVGILQFNKKENISKHFSRLKPYQVHKSMFERIFNSMQMTIPGSHTIKATLTDVRIGKQNPLRVDFYTRFDNI